MLLPVQLRVLSWKHGGAAEERQTFVIANTAQMNSVMNDSTDANSTKVAVDRLPRSEGIAYAIAFIIEFITIIIGNTVVIVVFAKTRRLRQRKSHWLLINLAIADVLVGGIAGPSWLYFLAAKSDLWDYEHNLHIIIALETVLLLASYASLVSLTIISLERMYATLWPWKHRVLSARNYHVMIGLGWLLPLFLPCVSAAERYGQISLDAFNYIWLGSSCFFFLITVVSYVGIWIKFRFYKHSKDHMTSKQDRRLTVSSFFVSVASVMTSLPGTILSVAVFYNPLKQSLSMLGFMRILLLAAMLIFASSLVNPIIYSFRMPKFRRAALRVICGRSVQRYSHPAEMRNRAEGVRKH